MKKSAGFTHFVGQIVMRTIQNNLLKQLRALGTHIII